jgi:hypothetical protein
LEADEPVGPAPAPIEVFDMPVVNPIPAAAPTAVFDVMLEVPVLAVSALYPTAVFACQSKPTFPWLIIALLA